MEQANEARVVRIYEGAGSRSFKVCDNCAVLVELVVADGWVPGGIGHRCSLCGAVNTPEKQRAAFLEACHANDPERGVPPLAPVVAEFDDGRRVWLHMGATEEA